MLSLTPPVPKTSPRLRRRSHDKQQLRPCCRSSSSSTPNFPKIPSRPPAPSAPGELYQPFRPPPSPLPAQFRSLDLVERIDILRNRLGLWHEYAPLISSLSHDGFPPSSIEELTGISGVEQNRLVVAARVRDSLAPDLLPALDHASAAELLYEIRLLTVPQREAAARYLVGRGLFDGKPAQEVARAVKDLPRRRGDYGWGDFSADSPADCVAFTHFRLGREKWLTEEKVAELEEALSLAETDSAKERVTREIDKVTGRAEGATDDDEEAVTVRLPVVRLRYGEVAEAETVAILPASKAADGRERLREAPWGCKWEGEVGVAAAEKPWGRWAVLPGWPPVLGMGGEGGIAVEFDDNKAMPWTVSQWQEEEALMVVVDRKRMEVGEGEDSVGFYLVGDEEGRLGVERGGSVGEKEVLGAVVLLVRPPKEEEDDQLSDEDWE